MNRFSADASCPICGGFEKLPRGHAQRCFGFLSSDGRYVHCTRGELAGVLPKSNIDTYVHRLGADCRCGCHHRVSASSAPDRTTSRTHLESRVVARYAYRDESGELLYEVERHEPKRFLQRRPGDHGGWIYKLDGVRRVPYRLQELIAAAKAGDSVWVVEGEKDADTLHTAGMVATCNPGGAGKWRPEFAAYFRGANVTIVQDKDVDLTGQMHARAVQESLLPVAASVRVVEAATGKDASDHLHGGYGVADFVQVSAIQAPRTAPQTGLALVGMGDLIREPEEEMRWLVDELLLAGGLSVLAGKPKAGKSTLARSIALAVAQGVSLLGRQANQGSVIYLALEDKRSEVKRHFETMGARESDPVRFLIGRAPDRALALLAAEAAGSKPALIVVDTMARLARVRDLNDYAGVTAALEPLLAIARESGAHVLLVHHAKKGSGPADGEAILGSTAIFGSVDTALILERTGAQRLLSSIQRYGTDMAPTVIGVDERRVPVALGSKEDVEAQNLGDRILEFIRTSSEPVPEAAIHEALQGRRERKLSALHSLVGTAITRSGSGRRNSPYLYSVPDGFCSKNDSVPDMGGREREQKGLLKEQALGPATAFLFPDSPPHEGPREQNVASAPTNMSVRGAQADQPFDVITIDDPPSGSAVETGDTGEFPR